MVVRKGKTNGEDIIKMLCLSNRLGVNQLKVDVTYGCNVDANLMVWWFVVD